MPQILHSMGAIYGPHRGRGDGVYNRFAQSQPEPERADIRRNMENPEYLLERDLIFVGSPRTVARKIEAAAREGLFNVFGAELNVGTLPEADLMRSIRLFGREVMPALRDLDPPRDWMDQEVSEVPARRSPA